MSTPLRERPDAPLGTLIFRAGLLPAETIENALEEGVKTGRRLGEILVERNLIKEEDLTRLLAGQKGLPFVSLRERTVEPDAARLLSEDQARLFTALPIGFEEGVPVVAVADPTNDVLNRNIREALGQEARFIVVARSELNDVIGEIFSGAYEAAAPAPEVEAEPQPLRVDTSVALAESELPAAEVEVEVEPEPALEAEPAIEAAPEQKAEPHFDASEYDFGTPASQPEPEPEPAFEPEPEPAAVPEPVMESAPEPVMEVAPEPVTEVPPEPTVETVPEPVIEVAPELPAPTFEAPTPAPDPESQPEIAPLATEPFVPQSLPQSNGQVHEDFEDDTPPPAASPGAAHRVSIRLTSGERMTVAECEDIGEAKGYAKALTKQLGSTDSEDWPFVNGRFLKPDTIVSVDVEEL
jgi:hypothetical protein